MGTWLKIYNTFRTKVCITSHNEFATHSTHTHIHIKYLSMRCTLDLLEGQLETSYPYLHWLQRWSLHVIGPPRCLKTENVPHKVIPTVDILVHTLHIFQRNHTFGLVLIATRLMIPKDNRRVTLSFAPHGQDCLTYLQWFKIDQALTHKVQYEPPWKPSLCYPWLINVSDSVIILKQCDRHSPPCLISFPSQMFSPNSMCLQIEVS